jgi:hypothetical protein
MIGPNLERFAIAWVPCVGAILVVALEGLRAVSSYAGLWGSFPPRRERGKGERSKEKGKFL